ncbi:MAG: DUF2760 domain-containing protein [Francisellaceae bacterium]
MKIKLTFSQRIKALFCGQLTIQTAEKSAEIAPMEAKTNTDDHQSAKQLLALLQQKGRFIDFINENIDTFSDEEIAAAARIVHQGCQKMIKEHIGISVIREEAEDSKITLEPNFDRHSIELSGNIHNQKQFSGILLHKGWKVDRIHLPTLSDQGNADIIQAAKIEVH